MTPTYSVLQGATNESSTQFVILVPVEDQVQVHVSSHDHQQLTPTWINEITKDQSKWKVVKLKVDGLLPNKDYLLTIKNAVGETLDLRTFQSLDPKITNPRIVLASCMMDWIHNPFLWKQMESAEADVIFFLGDTTYADIGSVSDVFRRPDPESINHWERFASTRNALQIFKWKNLKPIIAIADDHDFGYNNADSSFGLKVEANFTFDAFFGQSGEDLIFTRGLGNSLKLDLFGKSFLLLDGRNFRTRDQVFSGEQMEWLRNLSYEPRTFIITGSQFFGAYLKKDSLEGDYRHQLFQLTETLKSIDSQFVFVSGDTHFSEVMRIEPEVLGYETLEITSSSVHSFTLPGMHALRRSNPRRVDGMVTSTHNFVTLDWEIEHPSYLTVSATGWRGQNLFTSTFNLEKNCEDRLLP